MRKFRLTVLTCGLFFCLIYFFHRFPGAPNPNEYSRIYQIRAIVEQKTLAIDSMISRYKHLMDKSEYKGHFYSDKSFGLTLMALPLYYVYFNISGACADNEWMKYFLSIFCVIIPHIIFILMLYLNYVFAKPHRRLREFVWIGYSLGTIVFAYCGLFYSHVTGASLLAISFIIIDKYRKKMSISISALTGFLLGLSVIVEYPLAIIVFWLFIFFLINLIKDKKMYLILPAVILFFIPIFVQLWVNYLSFGDWFTTGYAHKKSVSQIYYHSKGFFGVALPSVESMWGILFSPSRGLYYFSPFLMAAYPVIFKNLFGRKRDSVIESIILMCIIFCFTWFSASVVDWKGGWTVGPRYYIGAIPFLIIAILRFGFPAFRRKRTRNFSYGLMIASIFWGIIHCVDNTAGFPFIPESFSVPLWNFSAVLISKGYVSPNIGNLFGLKGELSLCPLFFIIISITEITYFLKHSKLYELRYIRCFVFIFLVTFCAVYITKFLPEGDTKSNHLHFSYIYKYLYKPADYIDELYLINKMEPTDMMNSYDLAINLKKNGFYSLAKDHFEKILSDDPAHEKAGTQVEAIVSQLNAESQKYNSIKSGYCPTDIKPLEKALLFIHFGDYKPAREILSDLARNKTIKQRKTARKLLSIMNIIEKYGIKQEKI